MNTCTCSEVSKTLAPGGSGLQVSIPMDDGKDVTMTVTRGPEETVDCERKCYCSTAQYPKADPVRDARKAIEQELLPVNQTLSELQSKVRSMYINEMRSCICGAAIPDNVFPKTCACKSKAHASKVRQRSPANGPEYVPCPNVGAVAFTRGKRSVNMSQTACTADGQEKRKHSRKHKDRSNQTARNSQRRSGAAGGPPLPRNLVNLAMKAFYQGPVSHYLNKESPRHYSKACGCSSQDSIDGTYSPCALSINSFPLRPGQAMTSDPDDNWLRLEAAYMDDDDGQQMQLEQKQNIKLKLKMKKKKSRSGSRGSKSSCGSKSSKGSSCSDLRQKSKGKKDKNKSCGQGSSHKRSSKDRESSCSSSKLGNPSNASCCASTQSSRSSRSSRC